MKRQELHLLNRIYIYPPGKKMLPYFGDSEDVITPDKVLNTLNQLHTMEYDETIQNSVLKLHLPKKYKNNIHRDTIYVMTKDREMFQNLKDLNYQDEEAIFDWLLHYWQEAFLMTFPIYLYHDISYTFNLKKLAFEISPNNYHYLIEQGSYTVGNGVTLLLSLNSVGWISNEMTWNVLHRFIEKISDDEWMYNIPDKWVMYYYPHNLHIADFPFLYAFQFCDPLVYQSLYSLTSNRLYYFMENNEYLYISNIFTVHSYPQKHHYQFIKKTRESLFCIQKVSINLHFNIYQRLLGIVQSSSDVYQFLSNDLNRRFLIHCIYKNKRLGLLKFIQSISYLYHNSLYSKRYLKLIWRNIMNQFNEDFVEIIQIYLLEYFLLESNAKSSYSLLCPPLKMLRDTMYLLKDHFSLHKKINFSMIIAKKYHPYLRKELFHSPQEFRPSHNKYILHISFLQILKLIKPYSPSIHLYLQRMEKKRITLLQCCYKKSYEIYQVMQKYYCRQPDALWKV